MAGNHRFVSDSPEHPRQDAERRDQLRTSQKPMAALFGCSDSRLAAEIIFDLGLGDLFVVRNAGQIIADSIIGSLEYAVEILDVKLIMILGHDACGAVSAAIASQRPSPVRFPPHIEHLIEPIIPAVRRVTASPPGNSDDVPSPFEVGRELLRDTTAELLHRSPLIADAVAANRVGIVAANYQLHDGHVDSDLVLGVDFLAEPSPGHEAMK